MSIIEQSSSTATETTATAPVDQKLEVVILPVSDVDRAKEFYGGLGWRLDADFVFSEDYRVIQMTPPGSQASVIFGSGVTAAVPGSAGSLLLAVGDVAAARTDLIERGADVSEVFHGKAFSDSTEGRVPGPDPEGKSYSSFASLRDPDGNEWLLQEVTTRLPGRVDVTPVDTLAGLLLETAIAHGSFEAATPPHDWWHWYAPYLSAREQGHTAEQATEIADSYMQDVHGVVRG